MKFEKIKNKGKARLFRNSYLEILTKSHPLIIWGIYIPIISFLLYYAYAHLSFSVIQIIAIFIGGLLFWSLFEYIMHRYLFHFMSENPATQRFIYILHGNHHEYPRDRERLFMPPVPSILMSSVIFGIQYLVLRDYTFIFFSGFMIGYLLYGTMHYAIHAWNPPFKWMKPLWRNHHLHHYKNEEKGFGVSSTLWDHVFGTMFDLDKEKEDKTKVQELMFDKKAKEAGK